MNFQCKSNVSTKHKHLKLKNKKHQTYYHTVHQTPYYSSHLTQLTCITNGSTFTLVEAMSLIGTPNDPNEKAPMVPAIQPHVSEHSSSMFVYKCLLSMIAVLVAPVGRVVYCSVVVCTGNVNTGC